MAKEKPLEIKVKYFNEAMPRLEKIEVGDWIDLRCAQPINLLGRGLQLAPLGIAVKLPEGYEAHIVPRSSTFKKWGVIQTNHMGVVDESYCGPNDEWFWPCLRVEHREGIRRIPAGTRVCQFRIVKKMPAVVLTEVEELDDPDRGGHGSTGTS